MKKKRATTGVRQLAGPELSGRAQWEFHGNVGFYRRYPYRIEFSRQRDRFRASVQVAPDSPAGWGDTFETKDVRTEAEALAEVKKKVDAMEAARVSANKKDRGPSSSDRIAAVEKKMKGWPAEKREKWRRRLNEILNSEYGMTAHLAAEKAYREMNKVANPRTCVVGGRVVKA